jgi:uncharacterized membrane protein
MNGKLIAHIEREFDSYVEILDNKLAEGAIDIEQYIKMREKLEEWRDRFDDLIFAEVSE